MFKRFITLLVLLFISSAAAPGQTTTLKVSAGFSDTLRVGRWATVFATIGDEHVRNVELQIAGTFGGGTVFEIRQQAVVQPLPQTYRLLFPINGDVTHISVRVSDAETGRTLATAPLENLPQLVANRQAPLRLLGPRDLMIGIAGNSRDVTLLNAQFARFNIASGAMRLEELPDTAIGYDGLSALILAAPDLRNLTDPQQQAIIAWVKTGGCLLYLPGPDAPPSRATLLRALPCAIGLPSPTTLPSTDLQISDPPIFYELKPLANSSSVRLFDGSALTGCVRQLGLGSVIVLPLDISSAHFPNAAAAVAFWRRAFAAQVDIPAPTVVTEIALPPPTGRPDGDEDDNNTVNPQFIYNGRGARENGAIRNLLTSFDASTAGTAHAWQSLFSAIVVACAVLGPLESLVLLRSGRRVWNFWTIAGWTGLAILAFIPIITRENAPASLRAFRLVDQSDNHVIAATDVLSLISPRSELLPVNLSSDESWEPAAPTGQSMEISQPRILNCRQDVHGTRPATILLAAYQAQSLRGESVENADALIDTDLKLASGLNGITRVLGRIANRSTQTLSAIQISTAAGTCRISSSLQPQSETRIDEVLGSDAVYFPGLPSDVLDIASDRSAAIARLLRSRDYACVYGNLSGNQLALGDVDTAETVQIVRAVVPLRIESATSQSSPTK